MVKNGVMMKNAPPPPKAQNHMHYWHTCAFRERPRVAGFYRGPSGENPFKWSESISPEQAVSPSPSQTHLQSGVASNPYTHCQCKGLDKLSPLLPS